MIQEIITYGIILITIIYVIYKMSKTFFKKQKSKKLSPSCSGCHFNEDCAHIEYLDTKPISANEEHCNVS